MTRLLVLLLVLIAPLAQAADMVTCQSVNLDYRVKPGQKCFILASGLTNASGTSAGPNQLPLNADKRYANLVVAIGNAASGCVTGDILIDYCPRGTCASPAVPETIATLTGPGLTDTGSRLIPYVPGVIYQARFAFGDDSCDGNGGVQLIMLVDEY